MTNPWPNRITVFRGLLNLSLLPFLFLPSRWALWPALIYSLSAFLDFVDGKLARSTHSVTYWGFRMDMICDAIGVLTASLLCIHFGKLPLWYVLVGAARYLFVGGLAVRECFGFLEYALPERKSRRILAGIQMGFLSLALYPIVPSSFTQVVAYAAGIPFLLGFVRDWAYVSGWRVN